MFSENSVNVTPDAFLQMAPPYLLAVFPSNKQPPHSKLENICAYIAPPSYLVALLFLNVLFEILQREL